MNKIAIIGGGISAERDVSLRSARNVYDALIQTGNECELVDLTGEPDIAFVESLKKYNLVLPILHGRGGEDGSIQSVLESSGIKYLGSGVEASRIAFNKPESKKCLLESGLLVPSGMVVDKNNLEEFLYKYKKFVIKPIDEGSSIGTYICRSGVPDLNKINELLELYLEMLGEELIEGIEITVPVLGSKALPPVAIIVPDNEEFNLENKYNGRTSELCPIPQELISKKIQENAMYFAELAHKSIGARHISRTDMIVTADGELYILEINTMPGMTSQSLFPKSAEAAGISFNELVCRFVEFTRDNL